MEGRWIHQRLVEDASGIDGFRMVRTPVVPCDDAAIERVTAELRKRIVAPSNATEKLREIAVAVLRAAGATP